MQRNSIEQPLSSSYPKDVVKVLLDSYVKALGEYRKGNWQYCINEIGQFLEAAIRMIQVALTMACTPLNSKTPIFDEKLLIKWENISGKSEEYRIIIPRALYMMTCIRNKRGAIHTSSAIPNKMDARVLIDNSKWILSEFFRLVSQKSFVETSTIVDSIMNKELPLIWDTGAFKRILNNKMSAKNQILCLLYSENTKTEKALLDSIEYSNPTNFRAILRKLHKERFIEYGKDICMISPKGLIEVENLLKGKI